MIWSKFFTGKILFCLSILFVVSCTGPTDEPNPDPEEESLSAYITNVFDYAYAPGQHALNIKSSDSTKFIGKPYYDVFLGGFGGYIIAGFDHDVMNVENEPDFEIFSVGVSAEPAVVYVMCDENGDGIPNEAWFELKGSEFDNKETIRDYEVTYYKAKDTYSQITWKDNQGNTGELLDGNTSASTPAPNWWWNETTNDEITFTGTRLPDCYINTGKEGEDENWVTIDTLFKWGYAENNQGKDYDNETKSNKLDIANAIDKDGNTKQLPHIRFIKVQTGVFQRAGWLNEVSAEVQGARDLHYKK